MACYVGGERLELAADRFVLAAGVYGSPAILLRSGIGPQHELRRIGVAPEVDLQGVGRNLHDHPGVAVRFEPTRAAVRHLQADVRSNRLYQSQVILKAGAEAIDGDVALHLLPYQAPTASGDWRFEILSFAMRPRSRGSLTLRSTSPSDPPRIDLRFLTDRDGYDRSVLRRGVEVSRWIAGSSRLRELVAAELEPGVTAATTERLDRYLENTVGGYGHAVGTCRMGTASDPEAVVDRVGRVHGTENVFVADASIMPSIPAANTNLTCYVIGRHIAELLVGEDPGAQSI